jgi:O-antigen/teichoic acid export membrane protein
MSVDLIPTLSERSSGSPPPSDAHLALGARTRGAIQFGEARSFLLRYSALAWHSDLARKVFETYATQITLIVAGLANTVVVTRSLGPAGRGLYAVALAIGYLGVQFGNLGLPASNTYYLAQDRKLLAPLLGNSLMVSFGFGGLGAALVGLAFILRPAWAPAHGPLLLLGLAWIPMGLLYLLLERLLLGLHDVRSFNKVELMNRFSALALVAAVILMHRIKPEVILTANLLGMAVSCGWALSKLVPWLERFPWPSWEFFRTHFGVGMRAYIITALSLLLIRADLLMVKYLLGPEQTGFYSIASTMADYILMLPSVIALILFPRLSATRDVGEKLRRAKSATLGTAFALLPLLALAGVGARLAVRMLFGKAFLPAADAFIWLVPGIFSLGIEVTLVQFLNSVGYPRIVIWVWLLSVFGNVGANFWAIPRFGISGASAVSSISYSLALLAITFIIWRGYYPASNEVPAVAPEEISV